MSSIEIAGELVESGTKKLIFIKSICKMATGADLDLAVHVVAGSKPGPTLGMTCCSHGGEEFPIEIIKEIVQKTDPNTLSGNILALPVTNPVAFEAGTRNTPVLFNDKLNMNRVFPGNPKGRVTEKLAYAITEEIIKKLDCLIDFHGGGQSTILNYIFVKEHPGELGKQMLELSKLFPCEVLYIGPMFEGSASEAAVSQGIPALVPEIGHAWFKEEKYLKIGVQGVENVMKYLKMIPGDPILPEKQFLIKERVLILAGNGGVFNPEKGMDHTNLIGKVIPGGEILSRIVSPYTFEDVEVIKAPYEEAVMIWNRIGRSKVVPGDYLYVIGNNKSVEWIRK